MQKLIFLGMCSKQTALAHVDMTNCGPAEGNNVGVPDVLYFGAFHYDSFQDVK